MERVSEATLKMAIRRLNADIAQYETSEFLAQYGAGMLRVFEKIAYEALDRRRQRCETCRHWRRDDLTCWLHYVKPCADDHCSWWRVKEAAGDSV